MLPAHWLGKRQFLILTSVLMAFSFAAWLALLNNFTIEKAGFTGAEIGMLQSLREVPGFLAFTAVFLLLAISEQRLALLSVCVMTIGVALTGWFPFEYGLYATTVLMSIGFHYFETVNQSLQLQYLTKEEAPKVMGQLISFKSAASLVTYAAIWVFINWLALDFATIYTLVGGLALILALWAWAAFPKFDTGVQQHKKLILRQRYWLYYLLTFFSGARRQIFVVFAGFMLVEKFGYDASDIALLYILNHLLNLYLAPKIGRWIGRVGERRALTVEYVGLIVVLCRIWPGGQRRDGRRPLPGRSRVFCHGHRHQDLFPEDCRSGGLCRLGRGQLFHQPHCCSGDPCCLWSAVAA